MADDTNEVLNGRYELLKELGAGGMGTVYFGRDRLLGRTMAVKRCKDDSPVAEDVCQRG